MHYSDASGRGKEERSGTANGPARQTHCSFPSTWESWGVPAEQGTTRGETRAARDHTGEWEDWAPRTGMEHVKNAT